jgi:hypothetical protein
MQTRAPSSITATFQVLAVSRSAGMLAAARSISARVRVRCGKAFASIVRASTRRTFVSTTTSGVSKAKHATAAAV